MKFEISGIDDLALSMSQIAEIPPDVQDEMLNAQADAVIPVQREKARSYGVLDTGLLASSIKKTKPKLSKNGRCIFVYPQGYRTRGKIKARNAEIAFVNEYGTRSQKPRPFIRDANVSCADNTTQAAANVFDKWLQSKKI